MDEWRCPTDTGTDIAFKNLADRLNSENFFEFLLSPDTFLQIFSIIIITIIIIMKAVMCRTDEKRSAVDRTRLPCQLLHHLAPSIWKCRLWINFSRFLLKAKDSTHTWDNSNNCSRRESTKITPMRSRVAWAPAFVGVFPLRHQMCHRCKLDTLQWFDCCCFYCYFYYLGCCYCCRCC